MFEKDPIENDALGCNAENIYIIIIYAVYRPSFSSNIPGSLKKNVLHIRFDT